MTRALLTLGLVLTTPLAAMGQALSLQEVILRTKPATVLVVSEITSEVIVDCGGGPQKVTPPPFRETGTGWFIDSNGWIVTNGHVVQPAHELPRWVENDQAQKGVALACGAPLARAMPRVELKPSLFILAANGFRLPAKVAKYSPPVDGGGMSGRDLALLQVEAAEMPAFSLGQSKGLKLGDPLRILGFPGVVLTHELLNATAKVEASVTSGAVSGFKQDVSNHPVIQTDAPAAWGNSGGPVINAQGEVIGVLTFVSLAPGPEGALVQGFNFVIPAEAVREFVKGTPVDLADKSPFNERWFAGLRKFFGEDWKGAVESFRAADRLQPEFSDVRRMLAEAEEKAKNPPAGPFPWGFATGVVALLGVSVSTVGYDRRRTARRSHLTATDVMLLTEQGLRPLMVDARATAVYRASQSRLPGAVRVRPEEIDADVASLAGERLRTVVTYGTADDESGSARVAERLRQAGFHDVRTLKGGLGSWMGAGLPLESKPTGE
jgi:S1-C subfamily serine protease/rhodanese-related sulfurtransferase